jgi:hypothetical protein
MPAYFLVAAGAFIVAMLARVAEMRGYSGLAQVLFWSALPVLAVAVIFGAYHAARLGLRKR